MPSISAQFALLTLHLEVSWVYRSFDKSAAHFVPTARTKEA